MLADCEWPVTMVMASYRQKSAFQHLAIKFVKIQQSVCIIIYMAVYIIKIQNKIPKVNIKCIE